MKIILRDDVKNKGKAGQIIEVKNGFARNYLFPQGLAYPATDNNTKIIEQERFKKLKQIEQIKADSEKLKIELEPIICYYFYQYSLRNIDLIYRCFLFKKGIFKNLLTFYFTI